MLIILNMDVAILCRAAVLAASHQIGLAKEKNKITMCRFALFDVMCTVFDDVFGNCVCVAILGRAAMLAASRFVCVATTL